MSDRSRVVVPAEYAGIRADRVLASLSGLSRAAARRLIDEGLVTSRGAAIDRGDGLETGDVIEYPTPKAPGTLTPETIPFDVAFETSNVVVVDKPAGLVVHPGVGNPTGTLVNGLVDRYPELLEEEHRWGLVHRLDRDTSGLLLVARTPETHRFLQAELKERRIGRIYLTLVHGALEAATGTIEAPIGRDPVRPTRMSVTRNGRPARTHYRRLAEWSGYSLVEVKLETGRTHQIRVHMASIGNGIVGDAIYGKRIAGKPSRWLGHPRHRRHFLVVQRNPQPRAVGDGQSQSNLAPRSQAHFPASRRSRTGR